MSGKSQGILKWMISGSPEYDTAKFKLFTAEFSVKINQGLIYIFHKAITCFRILIRPSLKMSQVQQSLHHLMMTWLAISRMYQTVATGVEDLTSLCHCLGTLSVLEMCGDFHIWLTVMEGVGGVVVLSFGVGRNRQYK